MMVSLWHQWNCLIHDYEIFLANCPTVHNAAKLSNVTGENRRWERSSTVVSGPGLNFQPDKREDIVMSLFTFVLRRNLH